MIGIEDDIFIRNISNDNRKLLPFCIVHIELHTNFRLQVFR